MAVSSIVAAGRSPPGMDSTSSALPRLPPLARASLHVASAANRSRRTLQARWVWGNFVSIGGGVLVGAEHGPRQPPTGAPGGAVRLKRHGQRRD